MQIVDVTRGMDTSPIVGELIPYLSSPVDAAFSRFQTASVRLTSASTGLSGGDTQDVTLTVLAVDNIAKAQSLLAGRAYRFVGGDTLARAAIPIFVAVSIQLHARPGVQLSNAALSVPQSPTTSTPQVCWHVTHLTTRKYRSRVPAYWCRRE